MESDGSRWKVPEPGPQVVGERLWGAKDQALRTGIGGEATG